MRALVVALCLVAITDPRPIGGAGDALPVAVIDVSASAGGGRARVPGSLRLRTRWILVADGVQVVVGSAEPARLGRAATRLGAGLRRAAALHPGADVLLFTDGRETDGDALEGARRVAAGGGRVFVAPPVEPPAEVGLDAARLVSASQTAIIRAEVSSSTSGRAEVRLSRDGRVVDSRPLELSAGGAPASVELRDPVPPRDGTTYLVTLVPAAGTPDDQPGDNRLAVGLRPDKRVVLAWGLAPPPLAEGFVVRTVRDLDVGLLEGVDCLVMANVPWREIGTALSRSLERFVAGGGRLLVLGGPDAFAGGGWAGTPLEERLLPLRIPREEGTQLALLLALDRSGSTAGSVLAHLKDAARRAVQGLTPGERVAVLPFAGRPAGELLAPGILGHGDAAGQATLLEAIETLEAHGDTDLIAAVREAARRVAGVEARHRRVILLTDGDPDAPPDDRALRDLATELEGKGVEIAALVVGDREAATRLRAALARRPGDVELLLDASDLPLQLLHQIGDLRDARTRLPRPSRLMPVGPALPYAGEGFLPREVHRLEVAARAGAVAYVSAYYDDLEPAATPFAGTRTVGAGAVAAVAWGPDLEEPSVRAEATARFAPWIEQLASAADRGLAAEIDGETLVVHHPAKRGGGEIFARTHTHATRLVETQPGIFRGPLPGGSDGGVRVASAGEVAEARPLRLPSRPAPELRGAGLDEARMRAIAHAGGGERLAAGAQPPATRGSSGLQLAPWLLLLACILLVIERAGTKPDAGTTDLTVSGDP